jgi:hypothetical protein
MGSNSQHQLDRGNGRHWRERLSIIDAIALPEPFGNEARLELADSAVLGWLARAHHEARNRFLARRDIALVNALKHPFVKHLIHLHAVGGAPIPSVWRL